MSNAFLLLFGRDLLIVPYGIETHLIQEVHSCINCLLIVPYGIETVLYSAQFIELLTFNCTLWN